MEPGKFFRNIFDYFFRDWQRKIAAILIGLLIWFFVNHSISETKTIPNVPVRVINLPPNKTITGLLPNGILNKRLSLVLNDSKDVIEKIEPGDLEVVIDAAQASADEWIVDVTKKNLISLNPDVGLSSVGTISHPEFVIKLSPLLTAKIPVTINPPLGEPPEGFQFLGIWPLRLMHQLSGPEEEIQRLKNSGFELSFDLNWISKEDLENGKSSQAGHQDEIRFTVPAKWKRIAIPFKNNAMEEVNDPEALFLQMEFLKEEPLSIDRLLPVRVFFPPKYAETLNPLKYSLAVNHKIIEKNGLFFFNQVLEVHHVSRPFLDVVRDSLEITIEAAPKSERDILLWTLDVVNVPDLENSYIAYMIANTRTKGIAQPIQKKREEGLRNRFRNYLRKMRLYNTSKRKLYLESQIVGDKIEIH